MEIFIAMGVFFIVVTAIFVAVAVFLPEWIGITGKRAKEIMLEQQGDYTPPSVGSVADGLTVELTTPPNAGPNPLANAQPEPVVPSPKTDKPRPQ